MSMTPIVNGWRYTTPNEQRVYQPPQPEPFTAPRVTAHAVTVDGSVVEKANATFNHAKASFEKFLNDIPREHYSPEGLRAQVAKFASTDAAKAVEHAVESVRDRASKAAATVEKIRHDLSPNGDTAAELRAGRQWDRTKPLLDNAKEGAFARAQKLIASADREQLGVLLQELPAYLEAHGQPTDWIDATVGQAVPEYARAAGQLKKARQALTIAEHNATALRRSFDQGNAMAILVDPRDYDPD